MTEQHNKSTSNMIYTSNYHIPLGQAMKNDKGEYGLRVKKDKNRYEFIPINELMSQIIRVADSIV